MYIATNAAMPRLKDDAKSYGRTMGAKNTSHDSCVTVVVGMLKAEGVRVGVAGGDAQEEGQRAAD